MDTARLKEVEAIFGRVNARPRDQWPAALDELCGGDASLRAEVQRYLSVVGTTHEGPLDRPPTEAAGIGTHAALPPHTIAVGAVVGRYEILSILGEGGMGVVYRARQSRPSREVALKVIRPGLAGPALLRRFEFEAEMLGRLQHPGIAQIIEAGAFDTGLGPQPYFAMELVEGRTLLEHANGSALSQRGRLELMRLVCDAVEHAHQRGVIHRDLKPGNILVDATGQPKILDFGVARAVDSGAGANPQITLVATGERPLIGTLAYMSPEQVEADPARIDTRTDVYALGVILYQLVSGRLPHELAGKALADALRTVIEADAPSLSTVLSSARGDLETIAAKALEKDRERRYQSAAALADDLRRFLHDEPIAARPASTWYQIRKFTRRNRALVTGAGVAALAMVVGLAATAAGFAEARRERDAARAALARQQTTSLLLKQMLEGIDPEVAKGRDNFVIRRMLDDWSARIDRELASQPEDAFELRVLVGGTNVKLSQFDAAAGHFRTALALAETRWGADSAQAGAALTGLGEAVSAARGFADAETILRRALAIREKHHGDSSVEVAEVLTPLGFAVARQGRDDEAEAIQRRTVAIRERSSAADSLELLNARADLAMTIANMGRFDEAISMSEGILAKAREARGPDSPSLVRFLQDTAIAHYRADHYQRARELQLEALALAERVVPGDSYMAIDSLDSLCNLDAALGDNASADAHAARALEMKRRVYGERSLEVAQSLQNRAHALMSRGEAEKALPDIDLAIEVSREASPESITFRDSLYIKGQILTQLKRPREAEPILRELLGAERRVSSPDSRDPIMTATSLATVLLAEGFRDLDSGNLVSARERAEESLALSGEAEAYFVRQKQEKAWRRATAQVGRAAAEALALALREKPPDAPARFDTIMREAEAAFAASWASRAEMPANSRGRVLQSIARNTARIAYAAAFADTDRAGPWKSAANQWGGRADAIPAEIAAESPKPAGP